MDDDWELRSHLLSMNEIEGRHTGETMAQDLFDTVAKMICTEKVSTYHSGSTYLHLILRYVARSCYW